MRFFVGILFCFMFASTMDLVGKKYDSSFALKNEVLKSNPKSQSIFGDKNKVESSAIFKDYICPIKNVKISQNVDFLGFVELGDSADSTNGVVALSSPKYAFRYYFSSLEQGLKAKIYLTDYKSKNIIDAKKAHFVFGSSVMSVGGDDLIPFEKESDAKEFLAKNSGNKIYRFENITQRFVEFLDMR